MLDADRNVSKDDHTTSIEDVAAPNATPSRQSCTVAIEPIESARGQVGACYKVQAAQLSIGSDCATSTTTWPVRDRRKTSEIATTLMATHATMFLPHDNKVGVPLG
jgi:hypothetical protein